jgi:hypothetical protein
VLQHPLEVRNAKNSARLLHLCLPGSRLAVGERFDPSELASLLTAGGRTPVLLYPATPGEASRCGRSCPAGDLAPGGAGRHLAQEPQDAVSESAAAVAAAPGAGRPAGIELPDSQGACAAPAVDARSDGACSCSNGKKFLALSATYGGFDGFVQQQSAKTAHLNPS